MVFRFASDCVRAITPATISRACAPPGQTDWPLRVGPDRPLTTTRHASAVSSVIRRLQLFDLVADVSRYPEFLPWCHAARVRRRDGRSRSPSWRRLRPFHEKFVSRVDSRPTSRAVRASTRRESKGRSAG